MARPKIPKTDKMVPMNVTVPPVLREAVDALKKKNGDHSRSETVSGLLLKALGVKTVDALKKRRAAG